ncbi:MAG: FAD-dependent oxidoreductase [Elusimicrobia bacterium]|nr:FAD-dependent oxidoreductase [Elusimicrobiota bacterium]
MKTAVFGAGITGLNAALKLNKNGIEPVIVEEKPYVGGIAATVDIDGRKFDHGPHAYHSNIPEILSEIKKLGGDELMTRGKEVRIKFKGKYYRYPLEATDVIFKLNPLLALSAVCGYLLVNIKNIFVTPKIESAEDWIISKFGHTLYSIYFGPYTQKVWGVPPSQLSHLFARHRIPHNSLTEVLKKSFLKGARKLTGKEHKYSPLVIEFFYPKHGAGVIPERMFQSIDANSRTFYPNSKLVKLNIEKNRITSAIIDTSEGQKELKADNYISTIPINDLVRTISPEPDSEILSAVKDIRYRSIAVVCLVIDKPKVFDFDAEWIYFTNKIFNRLSDIKNCGAVEAVENGRTGLMAEITCNYGDDIWNADKNVLVDRVAEELRQEKFIEKKDVIASGILKVRNGYPIYNLNYEKNIGKILKYIKTIENLITTGRQGMFKYVDMDVAMEMGALAAEHIAQKKEKNKLPDIPFEEMLYA